MSDNLFADYGRHHAYDEMFDRSGEVRPHCAPLFDELQRASPDHLSELQLEADKAFSHPGHHVHGLRRRAGQTLERGLTQRLTAINLFLKDVYHEGRILAEGVVPRELVQSCRHFRREMRGVLVHGGIYVSVAGTDLVRGEDGRFVVLEDNLRVPSGVSYMLANREVTKQVMPGLFDRYHIRPIAQYGQLLCPATCPRSCRGCRRRRWAPGRTTRAASSSKTDLLFSVQFCNRRGRAAADHGPIGAGPAFAPVPPCADSWGRLPRV